MTKWTEMPLRPQGQPWPGLNTRGGKLDPGQGQLEDGSFNAVINEADILEKRKGFVRGLDERFDGPVCGLFRYTSDCGVEYLVVADSTGIFVRTPFDIPTFLGSDSFPNDEFTTLDTTRWSNTTDYEAFQDSLILNSLSVSGLTGQVVPQSRFMQWFKEAALTSYQVEIQYAMVAKSLGQAISVVIKEVSDTYLRASIFLDSTDYVLTLDLVQSGVSTVLATSNLDGGNLANGFLRLSYNATTRVASARAIPSGGDQVTLNGTLSEAQDNNLGQNSSIGMAREGVDQIEILQVTGGSL